jgi:hypothetical protein
VFDAEYDMENASLKITLEIPLDFCVRGLSHEDIQRLTSQANPREKIILLLQRLIPITESIFPSIPTVTAQLLHNQLQQNQQIIPSAIYQSEPFQLDQSQLGAAKWSEQQYNLQLAAQFASQSQLAVDQMASFWDLPIDHLGPKPLIEQELDSIQAIKEKFEWPWITLGLPSAP